MQHARPCAACVAFESRLRGSLGFHGDIGDVHWDTALTYMTAKSEVNTNDLVGSRLQLALNGFGSLAGSAPCTAPRTRENAGRVDLGCYFFNPFTNSVAVSAVNGQPNPYYRGDPNPGVINSPMLVEWLYGNYTNEFTNDLMSLDAVVSGELPWKLWGDNIGWAAGGHWRQIEYEATYGDLFNTALNPCVDSVDDGSPGCANAAGPLIFFGSDTNFQDERDVYLYSRRRACRSRIRSTRAWRYASKTTAARWARPQIPSSRCVGRRSIGSPSEAQRARPPPLPTLDTNCATGVVQISGQYRAQESCGNPSLQPETADAFNVGVLFSPGNFTASIDYFLFEFEGELTLESSSRMFATGLATSNVAHPCNDPTYAALKSRFTFAQDVCSAANVLRVSRNNPARRRRASMFVSSTTGRSCSAAHSRSARKQRISKNSSAVHLLCSKIRTS